MKSFLSKTRENSPLRYKERSKKPFVWILVAFVMLIFAKDILGGISSFVTTPFFMVRHYLENSTDTVPVFFRGRMELVSEIQRLEQEILAEKGKQSVFAFMEKENEELRRFLHASSTPQILAGVIARPPFTPYDTLIIDKGTEDGIVQFAPVYFGSNMAVGYVREAFSSNSLITLFSSPGAESTVYVFGPDVFTVAYGEGGGVIRLSIPQGVSVAEGDVVVLPSLDAGVLGTVDYIRSVPTEPEQHAYVLFDTPLQSIRMVSIGTSSMRPITFEEASDEVLEAERRIFMLDVPPTETGTTTGPEIGGNATSSS